MPGKRPYDKSIQINACNVEDLTQISGVGPEVARRVVDYRKRYQRIDDVQELIDRVGIPEEVARQIGRHVVF